jgi:hypothetical protein
MAMSGNFSPLEHNLLCLLNRRLGGLQRLSGHCEEENILYFAPVGNRTTVTRVFSS